jgi:hypothetical protein
MELSLPLNPSAGKWAEQEVSAGLFGSPGVDNGPFLEDRFKIVS